MKRIPLLLAALVGLLLALAPTVSAANFPARIDLPNGWQPEGITSGPGTTFYAGSRATGAIWVGDVRTGEGHVLVEPTRGAALGLDYQASTGILWAAGGPTGTVSAYDAATGDLLGSWQFDAGFLNDLVATPDAVYVTDSLIPQLVVIPLGAGGSLPAADGGITVPLDPAGDLQYITGFNANGIVSAQGELIVVQSNTGKLFRVDPATGGTTEIDLGGATVVNGDGLELLGSRLFVVQNQFNQIAVVKLGPGLASGEVQGAITADDLAPDTSFDIPTTVTFAAGRLWAVNARFTTTPTDDTPYWVTRIP
jgi:sugar lactone lactonase YvrE